MNNAHTTYTNEADGLAALVFDTPEGGLKVVFRDTDADKTVTVNFYPANKKAQALADAQAFVG